jgi:hypothetical protein
MHGDGAAAALLGHGIRQLDHGRDPTPGINQHGPGEPGDLARSQSGLGAQEQHEPATFGVAPMGHMAQGSHELALRQ